MSRDVRRYKPDQISYTADGNIVSATYSKTRFEEKNKVVERIDKITRAIDVALEQNNWDLIGKLGDKNSNESAESDN